MIEHKPDISLVICTRNRALKLTQKLKNVDAIQARLSWELVVADNASTDSTMRAVRDFAASSGCQVQITCSRGRGVSCARNAAWIAAAAATVAYIDDDWYSAENYVDAVFECFIRDPRLGFVGGRILLHDPRDRRITIQEAMEPQLFGSNSFIRPGVIQGANLALRRAALSQVGGFDPWFGAGALFTGEDAELLARISAAGWAGAYHPNPVVYHHHGRKKAQDEWFLMRSYDRGRGGYYAKCGLNKGMRQVYVSNWVFRRRYRSLRTSALEIAAGLEYVARAFLASRLFKRAEEGVPATSRE